MSLLLEALKKAELAKQQSAGGPPQPGETASAASESGAGLTLEPKADASPGQPLMTRDRLPDITQPLEIFTEDLATPGGPKDAEPAPAPGHVARRLFEDRFLLAGSPDRLARLDAAPEALRPRALDPDQLLLLDEGHCLADQALEVCGLSRRQARLDLGASSLSTLCGLVGQGFGLTFLPELAVAAERAAVPAMELRRFAAPEPSRRIALVRRAATDDDDWFTELGDRLAAAGSAIVAEVRAPAP